jgi:hypothetical protein
MPTGSVVVPRSPVGVVARDGTHDPCRIHRREHRALGIGEGGGPVGAVRRAQRGHARQVGRVARHDEDTTWFGGNGWSEVSHGWGKYYNAAKTVITVWTDAHHKTSSWFPSPTCGTTHIYYDANNFYGGKTGGRSGGVNTWATGSCKGLLTFESMVLRGD